MIRPQDTPKAGATRGSWFQREESALAKSESATCISSMTRALAYISHSGAVVAEPHSGFAQVSP